VRASVKTNVLNPFAITIVTARPSSGRAGQSGPGPALHGRWPFAPVGARIVLNPQRVASQAHPENSMLSVWRNRCELRQLALR